MWDLLLVTLAKLVTALAQPVLRWRARTEGPRQRKRIAQMATVPIAVAHAGARVRIAGTVEATATGARAARAAAFFVRDGDGARALVQPAAAAGVWASDGTVLAGVVAGDRVDIVGVARAPDARVDRELADGGARLVFAGSEAHPLFIVRR